MIELSLRKENEEVMKYFLNKESTTIGRASHNDICLPDPSISRTHVVISRKADKYIATDQSTNGTFVNGDRISSYELKPNDIIRVGPWEVYFASSEGVSDKTEPGERDPTRILSYRPDQNELVVERALLATEGSPKKTYSVTKSTVSIGKSKANTIVLDDEFISNFHCKIENRRGTYYLKDLNSTNGTLLNGQRIIETTLPFNSTLEIGKVRLRFFSAEESQPVKAVTVTEFEGIHSKSARMRGIFSLIQRVARSDATILVVGETGSGKELVARAIHRQSGRARAPYLAINCGAISKDLIESELFGHEKGAFTSAHQQRRGLFEQANNGTLFLDEIGELPLDLQPKLLRVLENGEIRRVGGSQLIDVDVRLVAATNRDLASEVKKGRFREDLYYRLFVVPILLPPLRERREDIPLLVEHFLRQEFAAGAGSPAKKFESAAMDKMIDYDWSGNVRELKNVISRAVLETSTPTIGPGDIQFAPLGLKEPTAHNFDETLNVPQTVTRSLQDVERDRILEELKRNDWNKKRAAEVLGIAKSTLHEKIKKYNIRRG